MQSHTEAGGVPHQRCITIHFVWRMKNPHVDTTGSLPRTGALARHRREHEQLISAAKDGDLGTVETLLLGQSHEGQGEEQDGGGGTVQTILERSERYLPPPICQESACVRLLSLAPNFNYVSCEHTRQTPGGAHPCAEIAPD